MKKVKLIYNPFSGHNKIVNEIDTIIEIYQKNNLQLIPFRISYEANLDKAFDDLKDGTWDHVLLAGGDGSVSKSIDLLKKKEIELPVGILPTGTANDFGNCIGMPETIRESCEQIIASKPKKIDLGKVNDKYFINILSFGMFTEVSQNTPTNLKNTMGKLAYYVNGIKEIPKLKRLKILLEDEENFFVGDALLVFVFNGRTAGNINLAYKAEIDDGLLDVIVIKADLLKTTKSLINFFLKNHSEKEKNEVSYFRTKSIRIDCIDKVATDIDGEKGPQFPLSITCEKHSLRVLGYKEREPKQMDKIIESIKATLPKKN